MTWYSPPDPPKLQTRQVHIWRVSLEQPLTRIEYLRQWLSPDEVERAERFYFERDRKHYIVGRGRLRELLSLYLNCSPDQIQFEYSEYGKPTLAAHLQDLVDGSQSAQRGHLQFNLSHSGDLVLYAFTHDRAIGVDIEYMKRDISCLEIADSFFSAQEVATLHSLPESIHRQAFFNCWTRKEAYIKAHGEGLSLPLSQFDVSLKPGEPAALLATRPNPEEVNQWTMDELFPGQDYTAAVVVEGSSWELQTFDGG
ncbi:4'-phosphopantetheinyl transferase superfamily protein [Chloroflexi bacterium TSY]|nr:4'-phosphopantetheinyl transferase superfamily protein [Chloroflexi bacterium TSY]